MGNCESDHFCPPVHEFATNRLRIRDSLTLVKDYGESDITASGNFGCVYAFNEMYCWENEPLGESVSIVDLYNNESQRPLKKRKLSDESTNQWSVVMQIAMNHGLNSFGR